MNAISITPSRLTDSLTPVDRGKLAVKTMAKELVTDHKRWHLPILSWQKGKIVATQP